MRRPWPLAVHRVYGSQFADDTGKTTIRDTVSQVGLHATEHSWSMTTSNFAICRPSCYKHREDAWFYILGRGLITHDAIAYLHHQLESPTQFLDVAESILKLSDMISKVFRKYSTHAICMTTCLG